MKITTALLVGLLLGLGALGGCDATPKIEPNTTQPALTGLDARGMFMLTDFAKGHDEKVKLGWLVGSPFKAARGEVKEFARQMQTEQGELLKDLRAWASANGVKLSFRVDQADPVAAARARLETSQGDLLMGRGKVDFQRDMLMLMWLDYHWVWKQAEELRTRVTDPALQAYLDKSIKIHAAGFQQVDELLKKYQALE